jgi:hypothetical protein
MQLGNWIPMSKGFLKDLPIDRPYTELEAAYSLQCDYDNTELVTIELYSKLWRWSRGKVTRFINGLGCSIEYLENSGKLRNQRGHIVIHKPDINRTYNGHKRLINSKWLANKPDINRTYNEHKTDISRYTPIDPKTKPNPENINITAFSNAEFAGSEVFLLSRKKKKLSGNKLGWFNQFWEAFDYKKGKAESVDSWLEIKNLDEPLAMKIIESAKTEAQIRPDKIAKGRAPKMAQGWLSGRRWEDDATNDWKPAGRQPEPFKQAGYYD